MLNRPIFISVIGLTCMASWACAADGATGCRPPTADEQAWMDANMIHTVRVLPNRLAMQRATAERQTQGQAALSALSTLLATQGIAEDGAEIIGSTGTALQALAPVAVGTLVSAVDNSRESWFPEVRDQGYQSSCACFATTYYTMTSQVARLRGFKVNNNDDTYKFTPRFTYNQINRGEDNGSSIGGAYAVMQTMGNPTWKSWPYNDQDPLSWPTTAPIWREALTYRMAESGAINDMGASSGLNNAKQMLANGYILNYATQIMQWQFTNLKDDPATTADDSIFSTSAPAVRRQVCSHLVYDPRNTGHAMTIVGYDDNLWCDLNGNNVVDTGEKGAFRIVNSWGIDWSDGGYTWISYDALKTTSAVSGGPNVYGRRAAFWGETVYWLKARSSYTPTMVAEITVAHAKRNQMSLSVGCGTFNTSTPTTLWSPEGLNASGGAYAFDGSTTAKPATFVIDCTDVLSRGTQQRWFVSLADFTASDVATLTAARMISADGTITNCTGTNPVGGLPKNADDSRLYAFTSNAAPTVATSASAVVSATGRSATLKIVGADDGGEANLTYAWSTSGSSPAAVQFSANTSNAAKNTIATFTRVGSYSLVATITDTFGLRVTSPVTVVVDALPSTVTLSPAQASVAIGTIQSYTATTLDQFTVPLATQPVCTWSVNGGGTICPQGLLTACLTTGGPFTVTASMANCNATAQFTVFDPHPSTPSSTGNDGGGGGGGCGVGAGLASMGMAVMALMRLRQR